MPAGADARHPNDRRPHPRRAVESTIECHESEIGVELAGGALGEHQLLACVRAGAYVCAGEAGGLRWGASVVEVRIRFGNGLARFAPAPMLRVELPDGATVEQLYDELAVTHPELAPALRSALPVVQGAHVERGRTLAQGEEVALLAPVAGG